MLIGNGSPISSAVILDVATPLLNNIAIDAGDSLSLSANLSAGELRSFGGLTINSGAVLNAGIVGFVQDQITALTIVNMGGQFLDSGSYAQGNGATIVNGQLQTSLFHVTGGTVTTGSSGILNIGGGGYTQDDSVATSIDSGGQMNVTGAYSQGNRSTGVSGTLATSLFHATGGSVSVGNGGVLDIGAGGYTQGTVGTTTTIASGGQLTITGGDFGQEIGTDTLVDGVLTADNITNSGTITGSGLIVGQFADPGSLDPGDNGSGTLSVMGNYTQTGFLDSDFAGLNSGDFLAVDGVASLNGTLNVAFTNGFVPQIGETFPVMSFESSMGHFLNITSQNMPPNETLAAIYSFSGVSVTVLDNNTTVPEPANLAMAVLAMISGLMLSRIIPRVN